MLSDQWKFPIGKKLSLENQRENDFLSKVEASENIAIIRMLQ